ncbi:hypothetical protein [Polymorphobacter megasporae]|uniref:hypothetical protein n=1 Tax=Glacieibacterium megasporae TaxID=2835787 RepID=UPI001C1E50CD|nr:hypothetical protein [Polymorphobacter megasporae]UAJ11370.1 hypothetical protein KTC28_06645 [Polymorphobacter megasporae]
MRFLIAAVVLSLSAPALADIVPEWRSAGCAADTRVMPAAAAKAAGFQRLDQLPPAAEYLTVYRAVGRCPAPVVVRYGIGTPRR